MNTLYCEMVHDISFSHLHENCDHQCISIHPSESQDDSPEINFQKFNKTKSKLFDEQEDIPMALIFEYVQGCTNISIDMHGKVDEPSIVILF